MWSGGARRWRAEYGEMARWPSPQPHLKFRCNKISRVSRADQVQRIFSLLPAPYSLLPTPSSMEEPSTDSHALQVTNPSKIVVLPTITGLRGN